MFALVVAFGACDGDGISIEVDRGDTNAVRVELYVVDGYCTTDVEGEHPCPQLKTPAASTYLDGEVYTRKDAHAFAAAIESDGTAYFTVRANGDHTRIPLAVAVGFDENDRRVAAALLEFEVYTSDYMRVQLVLEPIVEDQVTGRPTSDGLRVETWYEDPTAADPIGCLAFERTKNAMPDRKFIVPADDLDCDGYLPETGECDAIWPHHGPDDNPMSSQAFSCLAEESVGSSMKQCLLGDALCIDGEGPVECNAVTMENGAKWCVPSKLCDPICNPNNNYGCILGALKHPTMFGGNDPAYVHCKIPVRQELATQIVCRQNVDAMLATTWSLPTNTTCSQLSIGPVNSEGLGPFTTSRTSSSPVNTIVTTIDGGCTLNITFGGTFAENVNTQDALPAHVLKLDLTNGISLVVPFMLELDPTDEMDCTTAQATCSLVTSDGTGIDESLAACVRS
jgi:hypothetical protein